MTQTSINVMKIPNQKLSVNLTDDEGIIYIVDISLRTLKDGTLIIDIIVDEEVQVYGRRCINKMPLLLSSKLPGNIYFYDLFGNEDPHYTDLNDRYLLVYDTEYNLV